MGLRLAEVAIVTVSLGCKGEWGVVDNLFLLSERIFLLDFQGLRREVVSWVFGEMLVF